MAKRILFVCYDGYRTTNARVRCFRFSKELNKRGLDTSVFSFADNLGASHEGEESYRVGLMERLSLMVRAFAHLIREERSTVFYIQKAGYFAVAPYLVHLMKGNPYVLDYDDYEYEQSLISRPLLRLLARHAVCCVAASHFLEEFLSQFNPSVYYVPTGVDREVFAAPNRRSSHKGLVLCWLGIVVDENAEKNVIMALDACEQVLPRHKSARMEIVGGGRFFERITQRIAGMHSRQIVYKGRIVPDDVPKYLGNVDVGLFPLALDTPYNRAKSPTKLFEYMSMGVAPIASSIGEAAYIIQDGKTGLLASSPDEFAEKIRWALSHPVLTQKIAKQGQAYVLRRYSLQVLMDGLAGILNGLQ